MDVDTSICQPDHSHGNAMTCYTRHGCRCTDCKQVWNDYMRTYRQRRNIDGSQYGSRVSAAPVIRHVRRLLMADFGIKDIARSAGLDPNTVKRISEARQKTVNSTTADAILDIPLAAPDPDKQLLVASYRARRRLQALMYLGYTLTQLATMTGCSRRTLGRIADEGTPARGINRRRVQHEVYQAIDIVYQAYGEYAPDIRPTGDLTVQVTEIKRRQRQSAKLGYLPAWAWVDIDDPKERPMFPPSANRLQTFANDGHLRGLPVDK